MSDVFKTRNADGTEKTCKFCHAPVWWHCIERRWYDVGGEVLHVENCELGREHYRGQALDGKESARQKRTGG